MIAGGSALFFAQGMLLHYPAHRLVLFRDNLARRVRASYEQQRLLALVDQRAPADQQLRDRVMQQVQWPGVSAAMAPPLPETWQRWRERLSWAPIVLVSNSEYARQLEALSAQWGQAVESVEGQLPAGRALLRGE